MLEATPQWLSVLFIVTTLISIAFFYHSNGRNKRASSLLLFYSIVLCAVASSGYFADISVFPPRIFISLLISTAVMIYFLTGSRINRIISDRDIRWSTLLHSVRIPVEIGLYYLMVYKTIPKLMTFEGRNFDILAGITALIVAYLFTKGKLSNQLMLIWNIVGLCLVSFILINGIFSAELPFQQFGFDQPNRAILYFPYILLPAVIVPLVMFTHISDIILLLRKRKSE